MLRKRIARRLHKLAWWLDPPLTLSTQLSARFDAPLSDAAARALADLLSQDVGRSVAVDFTRADGTQGRVARIA